MNPMLKKLVDTNFMTEAYGKYIEEAIMNKDSFIISGHKGWGILPLMATVSTVAKSNFKIKQVKGFEDLNDEAEYYIIPDLKDIDFEKLVTDTIQISNTSMISIKDPDHPYSILKILRDVYKINQDTSKVYQVLECAKINDEKKLAKITKITIGEKGKLTKVDFEG
ncbi:hypothetical protein [Clostridium cylindrosporum]|uniref:Uncharacterized protein n=1 Tax=Clostridium cylindrosporum DSM 605 TaxID=1121307 RepID=A0A0J8D9H7_CLOCY|nr:hypothetical protein [Clostridium cylindrosporum]KMT20974.1 hypothetical protein CLCY_1c02080 [Clostridium cylindrosporum DSM 605]